MHRIRLDAAWQWLAADDSTGEARPRRIQLPVQLEPTSLPAVLERIFHPPTGITAGDRIQLCFAALPRQTEVWLNGRQLAPAEHEPPICFPLAVGDLIENNRISLRFARQPEEQAVREVGPVWLEIAPQVPAP